MMEQEFKACTALRYVRSHIRDMDGYVPGEQKNQSIKLNTNESACLPFDTVLHQLEDIDPEALRRYPDPSSYNIRQTAAELYNLDPSQVLVGNGSDDCLTILFRSCCGPDDRVLSPWPSYGLYETLAAIQNIEMVHVDYKILNQGSRDQQECWELPDAVGRMDAKLVLLANPNNPSGTLIPRHEIRRLADQIEGLLIVDEAYVDFSHNEQASAIDLINEHANIVVLRSFSKSYSLAGARLGLMFAHPELIAEFNKVKDSYNVNSLTQILGQRALADHDSHAALVSETLAQRKTLEAQLAEFNWSWPESHANFLLCHVGPEAKSIYLALKEEGILVRFWDTDQLQNYLRISVGPAEHNKLLITHLRRILGIN